jgi:hypothetical protein
VGAVCRQTLIISSTGSCSFRAEVSASRRQQKCTWYANVKRSKLSLMGAGKSKQMRIGRSAPIGPCKAPGSRLRQGCVAAQSLGLEFRICLCRSCVRQEFCKSGSRLRAVVSAGLVEIARRGRSDLSIIAPGRCAARMPGTGPLRRSSAAARKKAIVGKSRLLETHMIVADG